MTPERPSAALSEADKAALAEAHGGQVGNVLALSYSRLSRYQKCPKAFQLQYLEHATVEPSGAAIAGSAVHKVIEEMMIDGWWRKPDAVESIGRERFLQLFDEMLTTDGAKWVETPMAGGMYLTVEGVRWGGQKRLLRGEDDKPILDAEGNKVKIGEDYRWMQKMGPTWVKRAGSILRRDEKQGLVVVEANIERKVSAWLHGPGSTLITGIIDVTLLGNLETDEAVIRDWKTGTWMEPRQMSNYAWLLANIEDPKSRIVTTRGQLAYLRGASEDTWLRDYDLTEWIPLVPVFFDDMIAGVEAGMFPMQPSNMCGSCWVREHCPWGSTLHE